MDQEWAKRFRERLDQSGLTMKAVSLAAGLNETFVRDVLERGRVPSIDKFIKLARVVGSPVSELLGENSSQIAGSVRHDPEAQLRSALLAYGVDASDLGRAVSAVKVFVDDLDEQSSEPLLDDQSSPANRRRESEPSR